MYELIGVLLRGFASVVNGLAGSAVAAFAVVPCVAQGLVQDVAFGVVEMCYAEFAIGFLAAIHTAAAQQAGQFSDGYAIDLVMKDVVDTLLAVGNLLLEAAVEAFHYLAQEDTTLADGVEECGVRAGKQFLGQQVEHLVGKRGRGEDLIVGEVGQAVEHIGVVVLSNHDMPPLAD